MPLVLFAIFFSSCKALGPDYKRPELNVPDKYKSAAEQPAVQPNLSRDWWVLFGDSELAKLEEEALNANQDLKAAMARVTEAREAAAAVKSQFFPVIGATPSAIRSRRPSLTKTPSGGTPKAVTAAETVAQSVGSIARSIDTLAGVTPSTSGTSGGGTSQSSASKTAASSAASVPSATTGNLFQIPFDLSYEIDIWGRVRRSYEAAKAQARVSIYDLEVVRQTLLADVAQDYFNLRSLDQQDQILAHSIDLFSQEVDLTERQYKAGIVSETNVAQARAQLEATRVQEIDTRRQRADLEHAIAILLGKPPADLTLDIRPIDTTPPTIPPELPAEVLQHRPDVAEAEQNLVAANAQIGVAVANLYPKITLTGAAGFESIDIQHTLDWQNRVWSLGPSITAPIFQGGQLRANVRQAKAKYEELQATYRGAVLGAFRDVEDSLTDLHLRADEADAQAKAVTASLQYLDLTHVQYKSGFATYLQVIDAERTMLSNELSAAQILNQRMVSTVLLIKALGGGWEPASSETK